MKRAAVVLAVAFLPAALFQRRRPNRGAWGRRCLVGGACFCWAASLWSCFAVRAALTPGCRSRHARQRPLRRLPGRAVSFGERSPLVLGSPLDACLRNTKFPHVRLPGYRGLVATVGCVGRRALSAARLRDPKLEAELDGTAASRDCAGRIALIDTLTDAREHRFCSSNRFCCQHARLCRVTCPRQSDSLHSFSERGDARPH